jgi:hypothetical protein
MNPVTASCLFRKFRRHMDFLIAIPQNKLNNGICQ